MNSIPRYAVIGNPIEHSQSPFIHRQFAESLGLELQYERCLAPLSAFNEVVTKFQAEYGTGLNITLPFKEQAFQLATLTTARARTAGAANTLSFKDGEIYADNTDGIGLVRDITHNLDFSLSNKSILILGAGGAVRGAIGPLLLEKPKDLAIANRTISKAQLLASSFGDMGDIRALAYSDLGGQTFDIVINATSTGLNGDNLPLPNGIFKPEGLAYDMMYKMGLTPFLKQAQAYHAAQLADGLGMLVEQAAESFFIWHKQRPNTRSVMNQLRDILA
ncbi:MAG: shikimate dehydrogenase [Neisseriaceae bacterium]|nr:shikimate dehydrogenase [Neisseriaceae bacterium]